MQENPQGVQGVCGPEQQATSVVQQGTLTMHTKPLVLQVQAFNKQQAAEQLEHKQQQEQEQQSQEYQVLKSQALSLREELGFTEKECPILPQLKHLEELVNTLQCCKEKKEEERRAAEEEKERRKNRYLF